MHLTDRLVEIMGQRYFATHARQRIAEEPRHGVVIVHDIILATAFLSAFALSSSSTATCDFFFDPVQG